MTMHSSPKKREAKVNLAAEQIFLKGYQYDLANDLNDAAEHYCAALAVDLGHYPSWVNLGTVQRKLGNYEASLACARRALELQPLSAASLVNYGNALMDLGRGGEALRIHEQAVRQFPADHAVRRNYAKALREMARYEEALAQFETLEKNGADMAWEKSSALLHLGRMAEGWQAYESRWQLPGMRERLSPAPRWRGEPLQGKTILVYEEQGFGDTILCARYLPLLRERGAEVILYCRKELHRLMESLGVVRHVTDTRQIGGKYDYHVPMMSLPGIFGPDPAHIPPPAAIKPSFPLPPQARQLLALAEGRLKVGIVWSGSPHFITNHLRSVGLSRFMRLAGITGVQLYSLQKGKPEQELQQHGAEGLILPLGPHLHDFADTAAVIDALDLVVMTDSAVAHLAGAMNTPVWNLLNFNPYWLYQRLREDCPWYPSMRLIRQPAPGDWDSVFDTVATRLAELAAQKLNTRTAGTVF